MGWVWNYGRLSQCMSLMDHGDMGREKEKESRSKNPSVWLWYSHEDDELLPHAARSKEGRNTTPETSRRTQVDRKESLWNQDWSWAQRVLQLCWRDGKGHSRPGHSGGKMNKTSKDGLPSSCCLHIRKPHLTYSSWIFDKQAITYNYMELPPTFNYTLLFLSWLFSEINHFPIKNKVHGEKWGHRISPKHWAPNTAVVNFGPSETIWSLAFVH